MAGWPLNYAGVSLIAASLLLGCLAPVSAEKVGVAAAVNPDAFSSLSGTPNKQLNIGKSIFYNERINTTASGLVQVLLVDGSTFTVGPDSNLVIDRFVYDPRRKTGELVATFSKGTMRFIGGKLSKNDGGVKVNTPAGVLAIRGGMFQGKLSGNQGSFSFLYGEHMTFTSSSGKAYTVYESGYTLDFSGGTPQIRPTTAEDINGLMQALSNGSAGPIVGNSQETGPGPNTALNVETISLQDLISDATETQIVSTLEREEKSEETPTETITDPVTDPGTDPITDPGTDPPPDQEQPTLTEYKGYASGIVTSDTPQGFVNTVGSTSPNDVKLYSDDGGTSITSGTITVRDFLEGDGATNRYVFDKPTADGQNPIQMSFRTFNGTEYFLTATKVGAKVFDQAGNPYSHTQAWGYFEEGHTLGLTQDFPDIFGQQPAGSDPPPLCQGCDFMKWGVAGAHVKFGNGTTAQYIDEINPGWWIVGDLPTVGQLPQTGSATYSGHTFGTVRTLYNDAWQTYIAAGNADMDWNFAGRSGTLAISNFDAGGPYGPLNVSGTMNMPGQLSSINKFSGDLTGTLGVQSNINQTSDYYGPQISGGAVGSFARKGNDPAAGVIGNWHAGNPHYNATGIFGASRVQGQ